MPLVCRQTSNIIHRKDIPYFLKIYVDEDAECFYKTTHIKRRTQ